jgi:hypothetical protein
MRKKRNLLFLPDYKRRLACRWRAVPTELYLGFIVYISALVAPLLAKFTKLSPQRAHFHS